MLNLHTQAATYVFSAGPLDAVLAFTVVSLFNTLRFPLVVLPKALRGVSGVRSLGALRCVHLRWPIVVVPRPIPDCDMR